MIIDYLQASAPADIDADLCIIGGGAAGIAIARSFIGSKFSVCLAEAGGLCGEERVQAFYEGSSLGQLAFDPGNSRMRAFGGSCNLWGGGCIPLSKQDMGARDWVAHSGWPLDYEELAPYYRQARGLCQIEAHEFADGSFLGATARAPLHFEREILVNQVFARSPILFGRAYREELEQAANITILLHASLLQLQASAGADSVREASIGALDGRRGRVRARQYVLACGGIENARLLLLSDSVNPAGLGNQHDVVGRYFMDHPSGRLGTVVCDSPARLTRPYERTLADGKPAVFPEIGLARETQRRHRVLNGRVHPFAVEAPVPKGIRALRALRAARQPAANDEAALLEARLCAAMSNAPAAIIAPRPRESIGLLALQLGLGAGDVLRAITHKLADKPVVRIQQVALVGYFEQAPNPDSRITLGHQRDPLGQRRICVDWRLTALDRHTYRVAAALFGAQLARAGAGRLSLEPWLDGDDDSLPEVHGTAHHLGTTRMADDPGQGVVDRQCRVHGMDNLHIAGSSVFPTGGWAFPTFTIVALSLRLADQLRLLLEAGL